MDTQYKFRWILRDDDGFIEKALISFYEGVYLPNQPVFHPLSGKRVGFSNQFRAFTKLNDDVIYDQSDFGLISADDELRTFLNGELAKDTTRTPIPEQRVN